MRATTVVAACGLWLAAATTAHATPRLTVQASMPAKLKLQISQDVKFLGSIAGSDSSALYQEIFGDGPLSGASFMKFFTDRITGFSVDLHPDDKLAVAYHQNTSTKLFLTPNYINNDIPQVMRVSIFLHEARHAEREHGYWSHANCPSPYLKEDGSRVTSILTNLDLSGAPACDVTPYGSYGIQAVALKNIQSQCTNCSEKVKMDAGIYGDNDIESRIIDEDARETLENDLGG